MGRTSEAESTTAAIVTQDIQEFDEPAIHALTNLLKESGNYDQICRFYERLFSQYPGNDSIAIQYFLSLLICRDFQKQYQVRLHFD